MRFSVPIITALLALAVARNSAAEMRVRLIHAVPNAAAVSVSLGGAELFSNVSYKNVTAWKTLSEEQESKLVITTSDGRRIETDQEFDFSNDNEDYTILIAPDPAKPAPVVKVIQKDRDKAPGDQANLSLINASSEVQSASLALDTNMLHSRVGFAEIEGPDAIDAGAHSLRLTNHNDTVISNIPMTARGGASYTAVVFSPTDAILVDDISSAAPSPSAASAQTTATQNGTTGSL